MKGENPSTEGELGSVPRDKELEIGNTQKEKLEDNEEEKGQHGLTTIDRTSQTVTENSQTMFANNQEYHGAVNTSNPMKKNKVNDDDVPETVLEFTKDWDVLPKFSPEQHPLVAIIYIVNKAFEDTGAHYSIIGDHEYRCIRCVWEEYHVLTWSSLMMLTTREDKMKRFIEDLEPVFYHLCRTPREEDDGLRSLIFATFAEALWILPTVAFRCCTEVDGPSPHDVNLFAYQRCRRKWYEFFQTNRDQFILSPDVQQFFKKKGEIQITRDELMILQRTPVALLLGRWENRITLYQMHAILDQDWKKEMTRKIRQSRAPDLKHPEMAPPHGYTHLHGYWTTRRSPTPEWEEYETPISMQKLPANIHWGFTDHWIGRCLPDSAYVVSNQEDGFILVAVDETKSMDRFKSTQLPRAMHDASATIGKGLNGQPTKIATGTSAMENARGIATSTENEGGLRERSMAVAGTHIVATSIASGGKLHGWSANTASTHVKDGDEMTRPVATSIATRLERENLMDDGESELDKKLTYRPKAETITKETQDNRDTSKVIHQNQCVHRETMDRQEEHHLEILRFERAHALWEKTLQKGTDQGVQPVPPTFERTSPQVAERPATHSATRGNVSKQQFTITDYADYRDGTNFIEWMGDTWEVMEAHGFGEISNPWYTPDPNDPNEVLEFRKKQEQMFFVLSKKIRTTSGRKVVQKNVHTQDAQLTLQELISENYDTTKVGGGTHHDTQHSSLSERVVDRGSLNMFAKIISSKYDPSTMTSAVAYIKDFEALITAYNDQLCDEQCKFQGMMLWNFLRNAFSEVPCLRNIVMHEQEMVMKEMSESNYQDNKKLLILAATVYDGTRALHKANLTEQGSSMAAYTESDHDRGLPLGPSGGMPKRFHLKSPPKDERGEGPCELSGNYTAGLPSKLVSPIPVTLVEKVSLDEGRRPDCPRHESTDYALEKGSESGDFHQGD